VVLTGPGNVGKTELKDMLLFVWENDFMFLSKLCCRELRSGEAQDNINKVSFRKFQEIIAAESSLSTSIVAPDFSIAENAKLQPYAEKLGLLTPPDPEICGIHEFVASFLIKKIEEDVELASKEEKDIVVELSVWDAIIWKIFFPESLIVWITAEPDNIIKRHLVRYRGIGEPHHQLRLLEALHVVLNPPSKALQRIILTSGPLSNDTPDQFIENLKLIRSLCCVLRMDREN
jgi:guanylate kinase